MPEQSNFVAKTIFQSRNNLTNSIQPMVLFGECVCANIIIFITQKTILVFISFALADFSLFEIIMSTAIIIAEEWQQQQQLLPHQKEQERKMIRFVSTLFMI